MRSFKFNNQKPQHLKTLLSKNNVRTEQGFTFIELLIVIVTMVLLFGVGFANFREFQRRQVAISFARQMKADFNLAREYALAGRKPTIGCTDLDGYEFYVEYYSRYYRISPRCGGATNPSTVKTVNFPTEIDVRPSYFPWLSSINFRVLGRGVETLSVLGPPASFPVTYSLGMTQQLTGFCSIIPWLCFGSWLYPVTVTVLGGGAVQ